MCHPSHGKCHPLLTCRPPCSLWRKAMAGGSEVHWPLGPNLLLFFFCSLVCWEREYLCRRSKRKQQEAFFVTTVQIQSQWTCGQRLQVCLLRHQSAQCFSWLRGVNGLEWLLLTWWRSAYFRFSQPSNCTQENHARTHTHALTEPCSKYIIWLEKIINHGHRSGSLWTVLVLAVFQLSEGKLAQPSALRIFANNWVFWRNANTFCKALRATPSTDWNGKVMSNMLELKKRRVFSFFAQEREP